jgi:hypothetical protein
VFQHHDEHQFKKIIDEFILSSSNNESMKYLLKSIDIKAATLGISFYQMMFILIQIDAIRNRKMSSKDR